MRNPETWFKNDDDMIEVVVDDGMHFKELS